jgi:hypothetical protein
MSQYRLTQVEEGIELQDIVGGSRRQRFNGTCPLMAGESRSRRGP